jgi:SnoaL-like domain
MGKKRDLADLHRRLVRAESVLAIQDLKARYAELVDQRFSKGQVVDRATLAVVADNVAALFTCDGVWDGGPALGRAVGRDAIAARLREPTVAFTRHFFLNPRVSVHGDSATARWDVLSPCRGSDGTSYWMTGYEDDHYALTEGTWLHRSMKLTTVFMAPVGVGWTHVLA